MEVKQIVEMAVAYKGTTKSSVAEKLGMSRQLFNQRLNTGKFTLEELNAIAKALDADKAEIHFYFNDGMVI